MGMATAAVRSLLWPFLRNCEERVTEDSEINERGRDRDFCEEVDFDCSRRAKEGETLAAAQPFRLTGGCSRRRRARTSNWLGRLWGPIGPMSGGAYACFIVFNDQHSNREDLLEDVGLKQPSYGKFNYDRYSTCA